MHRRRPLAGDRRRHAELAASAAYSGYVRSTISPGRGGAVRSPSASTSTRRSSSRLKGEPSAFPTLKPRG